MCGICGLRTFASPIEARDVELVDRMTESLRHRGPDDRGAWNDRDTALGHRRLSIIDLSSAGRQPMGNEDGSVQIVFNGEVYNFAELSEQFNLVGRGHTFRSRSDTEVLVHLYEELGIEMARHLNGMYAFAIWDSRTRELHLVRDRYGVKPLFFTRVGETFLFASEIKSLLKDPRVSRRPSLQAMHDFLTFDYVPGTQTAFEGIFELEPAHRMTVDANGKTKTARYWELPADVDESLTEKGVVKRARELMDQAVRRQLVSDVPVGVLLSGGMDSSTIVALMAGQRSDAVHTYAVGFAEQSFNELPFARSVAARFQSRHREIVVTPELVREVLPGYLDYIDEPYGDGAAIPTYYVCRLAKQEVGVVLSGEGGDEVFAGYETYSAYKASRAFRIVPRWFRTRILAPLIQRLRVSHKKLSLEFKLKRFLGGQDLSPVQAHLWWRVVLTEAQKLQLYDDRVLEQFDPQPSDRHFASAFNRSLAKCDLSRLMYVDSSVFLPDDLMIKNDRMSMAHSLEARVPLTDHDLTEYMARVPMRIKFPRMRKKHIMRLAMSDSLPREIIDKKKVGLEMPYSSWLKHELRDLLLDYCGPQRMAAVRLFRPAAVQELIDQHLSNRFDHGRALWGLLNYMMWHSKYAA